MPRGRGSAHNPPNRFVPLILEPNADEPPENTVVTTRFFRDQSQSIITRNDSPDIPFTFSVNPYRGCEHGCAYCYARPTHEFLGFSAGLDFESRILVKENAPDLLRRELSSVKWKPQTLAFSGVTDPYQPVEHRLRVVRRCLEVLLEFRQPVSIVTKNQLITRDLDLLAALARHHAVTVSLSITSLDPDLARRLEPRTSSPRMRLAAVKALAHAGVPVGVLVAPIIPGLTDHEIPRILQASAQAGARWAGKEIIRLPLAVAPLFEEWLARNEPLKKDKILGRIRSLRGGRLNDPEFGTRMTGHGLLADQLEALFAAACHKLALARDWPEPSAANFRRPGGPQMEFGFCQNNHNGI